MQNQQILTPLHYCPCRFIVREFVYDPRAIAAEKNEKGKLEMQLKKQFVSVWMYRLLFNFTNENLMPTPKLHGDPTS